VGLQEYDTDTLGAGAFDVAERVISAPEAISRPALTCPVAPLRHGHNKAAMQDPAIAEAISPIVELRLPSATGAVETPAFALPMTKTPSGPAAPVHQPLVSPCFVFPANKSMPGS
jgi:hypothetical protein